MSRKIFWEEEGREPEMTIAVGRKGIGKTFTTKKIIELYAKGDASIGRKPRRVLIFDVNNEFTDYKTIDLGYIKQFSFSPYIEIRRVIPFKPNGQKMGLNDMAVTLNFILANYSNGLLLIEDISRYVADTPNRDIIGQIVTQRHINTDVYIHFQTKGKAGYPKLLGNCNFLRIHETTDTFNRHEKKFEEHLECCEIAETLVNLKNDGKPDNKRYFFVWVQLNPDKIKGAYSESDLKKAIEIYLTNRPKLLQPLLQITDKNGVKLYKNHGEAFEYLEKKLYNDYYGN